MTSLIESSHEHWLSSMCTYGASMQLTPSGKTYNPIEKKYLDAITQLPPSEALHRLQEYVQTGGHFEVFSDPHFEHANILQLAGRPFLNLQQMHAVLVDLCRAKPQSFLVCMGDWSLSRPLHWMHVAQSLDPQVNWLTVVGNHDIKAEPNLSHWVRNKAIGYGVLRISGETLKTWWLQTLQVWDDTIDLPDVMLGLSHWPIEPIYFPSEGVWINLHGHSHGCPHQNSRINASVETLGYQRGDIRLLLSPQKVMEALTRQLNVVQTH